MDGRYVILELRRGCWEVYEGYGTPAQACVASGGTRGAAVFRLSEMLKVPEDASESS